EILFSDGTPFYTVSARSGDLSPHVMVIDEVARSSGLRFDAAGTWAVSAVPEPASVFLMGMPLVAFAGYRLRSALRADRRIA
ncbi:MAG: hypothetical protein KIT73_19230, partial [Burkholderiales bacterium]|nr:hypothetical protein [Burkholderiales bacterium]